MKKGILLISLLISVLVVVGFWKKEHPSTDGVPPLQAATLLPRPQALPPFQLQDMHEDLFTPYDLQSRWSFLFFGYSTCPNVCPATLKQLEQLSQRLGPSPALQFLFITLYPQKDTPTQLKHFLETHFPGAPFRGISGKSDNLLSLAHAIGVHFAPIAPDVFEHSGALFLVNPEGQLMALFTPPHQPSLIARDLKILMRHWKKG